MIEEYASHPDVEKVVVIFGSTPRHSDDNSIVIDVEKPHDDAQGHAYIHWFKNPETSGMYRISHHFLEVVQ